VSSCTSEPACPCAQCVEDLATVNEIADRVASALIASGDSRRVGYVLLVGRNLHTATRMNVDAATAAAHLLGCGRVIQEKGDAAFETRVYADGRAVDVTPGKAARA
jgi:hypothetical protein